jgi:hypothetical protein
MTATSSYNDANHSTQVLIYIKRNPKLSLEDFYHYWENSHGSLCAPWLAKSGILSYRQVRFAFSICTSLPLTTPQIHTSGTILPNDTMDFSPHKTSTATSPREFDGIAMFEVSSIDQFPDAFKDPYFINMIDPDEHYMIDKSGFQGGLIASYVGNMVSVLDHGKSVLGEKGEVAKKKWDDFEAKENFKLG